MKSFLLLVLDGIFYMMHNVFAFTVIAMVAPLSYSVANAMKRVVIIGASLFLLKNPVTTMNIAGMLIACFGVLCYNKVMFQALYDTKKWTGVFVLRTLILSAWIELGFWSFHFYSQKNRKIQTFIYDMLYVWKNEKYVNLWSMSLK